MNLRLSEFGPGTEKRRTGRPRVLTTEQVLDAALELGLDGLTMAMVAERLGVSIGVLYGYVSSRDEMIALAAARAVQDYDYPTDTGQHWSVYAAQNAIAWYKFFTGPGQFLARYLAGKGGPAEVIDRTQAWLAAMTQRGFAPNEALTLVRQLGEIAIGGAVDEVRFRALESLGGPVELAAAAALAARRDGDDRAEEVFLPIAPVHEQVWHLSVVTILQATALRRGEALDEHAVLDALEA